MQGPDETAGDAVRAALARQGRTVKALDFDADKSVWRAELGSKAEALWAVAGIESAPPEALGEGVRAFRWYNELPYAGRGWCTLEAGASSEMMARLAFYPEVAAALAGLPPKLVEVSGAEPVEVEEAVDKAGAGPRIERIRSALRDPEQTQFMGRGDRDVVVAMFNEFVDVVGNAMIEATNALGGTDFEYEGAHNADGEHEGFGTVRFADGDEYSGEWVAGDKSGKGTFRFAGGASYEGEWKAGEQDGSGTMRWPDGDEYEGQWKDGNREGQGKKRWADGDHYDGQWADDMKHGRGKYASTDGCVYDGEWYEDAHQGHGTWRQSDGAEYCGQWKAGKRDGHGALRFPDGNAYQGEFKMAERDGHGAFFWADGEVEVGTFRASAAAGVGVRWTADRQTAWRLLDGEPQGEIALDEASALAKKIGFADGAPAKAPPSAAAESS